MGTDNTAEAIVAELRSMADTAKSKTLSGFFQTGKNDYGHGDLFLGVTVPQQRAVVGRHNGLPLAEIDKLLTNPYHECRLTGVLCLVAQADAATNDALKPIYDFYVARHRQVNSWDLVDLSAPQIVGRYVFTRPCDDLPTFAQSGQLWLQRIAMVATLYLIRRNRFADTLQLADIMLQHPHHLIQKATGWMLREVGKRDYLIEYQYLTTDNKYKTMPRTMLRYAIERFDEKTRQSFLKGTAKPL